MSVTSHPSGSSPRTILVVDDAPANLGLLVESLESCGYRVVVAQEGEEALTRAALVKPDLVLLDVMLPDLDGLDVCRRLRAMAETRDVPVLLMTALDGVDDKLAGFAAGAVDYVTKPVEIGEVCARVQAHLALSQERRSAEEQVRLLACALDCFSEAVYLLERDSRRVIYANEGAARLLGRDRAALVAGEALPDVELSTPLPLGRRLGERGRVYQRIHHTQGGRVVPIEVLATPFEFGGRSYDLHICTDISERRRLEEELRQAQKMEAVGKLAGGVAHDFNNFLLIVQLQSALLREDLAADDPRRDSVDQIMAAAERAATLTRQLLTFSRRSASEARPVDLAEIVRGLAQLLTRLLGEDVTLVTSLPPVPVPVHADPGMMEQVLMNLAVNARDAMPDGGRLSIELDMLPAQPATGRTGAAGPPGPLARLRIADQGGGIDPEHLPHIFEPFYTTKAAGHGTGLGLATVFAIVEQHGGRIEVDTQVNRGTTFTIALPALTRLPADAGAVECGRRPTGHETILLVEDDAAVRQVARLALERHGYTVFDADSAAAALEGLARDGAFPDLLLTDLVLPGTMSGRELAEHLRQRHAGLKIVYTSGYSHDVVQRLLSLDAGRAFLQKPYTITALMSTVRQCLDESRLAEGA